MNFSRHQKFILFFVFVFLVFFLIRVINGNEKVPDSYEYIETAQQIKSGDYFNATDNYQEAVMKTKRNIVYPLFLMFFLDLNDVSVLAFQSIIGVFNLFLMLKIFEKLGGKSLSKLSVFLLLTPSVFIYTHLFLTELFAMALVLLILYQFLGELTRSKILFLQLLIILLVFLKPVFYLFPLINLCFFIFYSFKKKTLFLETVIPVLLVCFYLQFNTARTGYKHFSSMQNINLIDYNIFFHLTNTKGHDEALNWKNNVYAKVEGKKSFKEVNEILSEEGKSYIKDNFISFSFFQVYGGLRGVFDPGRYDIATFYTKEYKQESGLLYKLNALGWMQTIKSIFSSNDFYLFLVLIPIFIFNILKFVFIVAAFTNKKIKLNFGSLYVLTLCFYYILLTGPVNVSRYMVVLQGVMIVFAVIGLESITAKIPVVSYLNKSSVNSKK